MSYWKECLSEALNGCELIATEEQLAFLVDVVEGAHENYGMAFGYDDIPNPLIKQNEELARELEMERSKVQCGECGGKGYVITNGPYHNALSDCCKCNGKGSVMLKETRR